MTRESQKNQNCKVYNSPWCFAKGSYFFCCILKVFLITFNGVFFPPHSVFPQPVFFPFFKYFCSVLLFLYLSSIFVFCTFFATSTTSRIICQIHIITAVVINLWWVVQTICSFTSSFSVIYHFRTTNPTKHSVYLLK